MSVLSHDRRSALVHDCLARVYILQCATSLQLLGSLHSLGNLLETDPSVRMLVFDSITSVYWMDQTSGSVSDTQRGAVKLLRSLLTDYPYLCILCAKALLFMSSAGGAGEYMDREWTQLVTHRHALTIQACRVLSRLCLFSMCAGTLGGDGHGLTPSACCADAPLPHRTQAQHALLDRRGRHRHHAVVFHMTAASQEWPDIVGCGLGVVIITRNKHRQHVRHGLLLAVKLLLEHADDIVQPHKILILVAARVRHPRHIVLEGHAPAQ
jgi:hypothetical protein